VHQVKLGSGRRGRRSFGGRSEVYDGGLCAAQRSHAVREHLSGADAPVVPDAGVEGEQPLHNASPNHRGARQEDVRRGGNR
jgi:hypothetical protein